VKVGAERDATSEAGETAHLGDYMARGEEVAVGIRGIAAEVVGLDDLGAGVAERGGVVIVDGEDAERIGVAREEFGSGRKHREWGTAAAGLAEDGGAEQIVA
jgi:hypothetical protein